MVILNWIQEWYKSNCDGDWEHLYGLKIYNLDNPGWGVLIDLVDTPLENKTFEKVAYFNNDDNWIHCMVKDGVFNGGETQTN
jgi:hypothetical protein